MTFALLYDGGKVLGQVRTMRQVPGEESASSDSLGLEHKLGMVKGLTSKGSTGDASCLGRRGDAASAQRQDMAGSFHALLALVRRHSP